jgi:alpha-tubulin suppressor-like RCC1 family protein
LLINVRGACQMEKLKCEVKFVDPNCPVVIEEIFIYIDTVGKSSFSCSMLNLADKEVVAVKLKLKGYNTFGELVTAESSADVEIALQDFHARQGQSFGGGTKSPLDPLNGARQLDIEIKSVAFADKSIWESEATRKFDLSFRPSLGSAETKEALQYLAGADAVELAFMREECWGCVCGTINPAHMGKCRKCSRELARQMTEYADETMVLTAYAFTEEERRNFANQAAARKKRKQRMVFLLGACLALVIIGIVSFTYYQNNIVEPRNMALQTKQLQAQPTLSAGLDYAVAILEDGRVAAWGLNAYGNCEAPSDIYDARAVVAGTCTSFILQENGEVFAFGSDVWGQCTGASQQNNLSAVAAGGWHALGLKKDGAVVAWGNNEFSQCNVPQGLNEVVRIAAGGNFSVALKKDGTVVAWGDNSRGQCDVPDTLSGVVAISAGGDYCVALKEDGTVEGWGGNDFDVANPPEGLADVIAISAGFDHCLALRSNGTVEAWGSNNQGQAEVPEGLSGIVGIAAGLDVSYAITKEGSLVAWGAKADGQSDVEGIVVRAYNNDLKSETTEVALAKLFSENKYIEVGQAVDVPGFGFFTLREIKKGLIKPTNPAGFSSYTYYESKNSDRILVDFVTDVYVNDVGMSGILADEWIIVNVRPLGGNVVGDSFAVEEFNSSIFLDEAVLGYNQAAALHWIVSMNKKDINNYKQYEVLFSFAGTGQTYIYRYN